MKKKYSIYFCVFLAAMVLAGSAAYFLTTKKLGEEHTEKGNTEKMAESAGEKSISVDTVKKGTITNKTVYELETYNAKDFTLKQEELAAPANFIGLTREELEKFVEDYEKKPTLEDMEKGFENFEIVSFSTEKIVLRKTYSPDDQGKNFYLLVEEDYITVYYKDKTTVYAYTDIVIQTLPEQLQKEIIAGKYIAGEEELYDFLENYSS